MSCRDSLTDTYNRTYFEAEMTRLGSSPYANSARQGLNFCL